MAPLIPLQPSRGPQPDERKVAGSSAEIPDQRQLIVVQALFVLVRRGYRFEFEADLFKSRLFSGQFETAESEIVVVPILCSHKMDWPSNHHFSAELSQILLRSLYQLSEDNGD